MLTIKDVKVFKKAVEMLRNEFTKQEYESAIRNIVGAYHQISPGLAKMESEGLIEKVREQYVDRMVERDVWRYPDGVMILDSDYYDLDYDARHKFDEEHQRKGEREQCITIKYPQKVKQNVWRVNRRKLDEIIDEFKRDVAEL